MLFRFLSSTGVCGSRMGRWLLLWTRSPFISLLSPCGIPWHENLRLFCIRKQGPGLWWFRIRTDRLPGGGNG
ncbi:hypothetical protein F4818DRAFT_408320 [Hypoxylon cercidicola]|nr:hypothetical protein F4818DRAFT_408320 [Hypoxylon cercidicola]